jgi:membrane-associated progesterone receptor component
MARTFTADELLAFAGVDGAPIYLSCLGTVFDVTSGADFYGPGAGYGVFAGKEVTRPLAKMAIADAEANAGWGNLNEEQRGIVQDWFNKYKAKYPVVGTFAPDAQFEARGDAMPVE